MQAVNDSNGRLAVPRLVLGATATEISYRDHNFSLRYEFQELFKKRFSETERINTVCLESHFSHKTRIVETFFFSKR